MPNNDVKQQSFSRNVNMQVTTENLCGIGHPAPRNVS